MSEPTHDVHGLRGVEHRIDRLTRERDQAVKDASDARREAADMRDAMRQARAAVERVVEQRDRAVRSESEARDAFDVVVKSHEDTARRLRESIEELERVKDDEGDKHMWVVSRTTTVQPGEYGDVFVWAADADGAAWEVLHGGYSHSQPLYGYTDRAHMAVRALDSIFTDDDDDCVVIAETAR